MEITTFVLLEFNHCLTILCLKLKSLFAFSQLVCDLIFTYLTGRFECVEIQLFTTILWRTAEFYLGPLLFSIYIIDINSVLNHCIPHLYEEYHSS